ncbi:MAG TPA: SWIM zinc finger family protein [Longimicrobiaceae bacterium]|nr:SWIM zinc finger family protein [Longimicrobiaceae bacterium]
MPFPLPVDFEIVRHALPQVIRRGVEYFRAGNVVFSAWRGDDLIAEVTGTEGYWVTLCREPAGDLRGKCTCPYMQERTDWCKHVVAAVLDARVRARLEAEQPLDELLTELSPEQLRGLVQRMAERDAGVYDLVLAACGEAEPAPEAALPLPARKAS